MDFIDHTGHIFQMKSYSINPIGYEYETTKYVFWFDNEQGYKNSIDTYAIKPIRFLLEADEIESIEISLDSKKFLLLSSSMIQEKMEELSSVNETISINESLFTDKLEWNADENGPKDLQLIRNLKTANDSIHSKTLVPFYAVCNSDEAGTWQTNILIHVKYDEKEEWCPLTIGAEVVDEAEELIINGQNMGIWLPKEILRAVYQTSFYNDYPDERLYAQKLKEYLMNYMSIRGQQGNYKSALNALKWFGWSDKLEVYKLIKTDNEFQAQYIRDNFDIVNDTLYSYRFFKNDALLSIVMNVDEISEHTEEFDFDKDFWGEDKPFISSLLDKTIVKHYDEGDLDFYRGYFDFSLEELGLKLCMLKYYYEKYFLPMHLALNSVSIMKTVFANDVKMVSQCYPKITAEPIFINDSLINVIFPTDATMYFKSEKHIVDENFIEFEEYVNKAKDNSVSYQDSTKLFAIYDTLIRIPITFVSENNDQYYDVILSLYKNDDTVVYTRSFQFTQIDLFDVTPETPEELKDDPEYVKKYYGILNFIVHPKTFNRYLAGNSSEVVRKKKGDKNSNENDYVQVEQFELNHWTDSRYSLKIRVNGNNYEYNFNAKLPDMKLKIGKLEYSYDNRFRQLCRDKEGNIKFLSYMHEPGLVTINNIDYIDDLYFFQDSLADYVDKYYKTDINMIDNRYLNVCHLYEIKAKFENEQGDKLMYDETDKCFKKLPYNIGDIEGFAPVSAKKIEFYGENPLIKFTMKNGEIDLYSPIDKNQNGNSQNIIPIKENLYYNTFFDIVGDESYYVDYCENIRKAIEDPIKTRYDFYLMRDNSDNPHYYAMLISKFTMSTYSSPKLKAPEFEDISFIVENIPDEFGNMVIKGTYKLIHVQSENKFLVNRFKLTYPSDTGKFSIEKDKDEKMKWGYNHFNDKDIIAFYLENNEKLPYKVGLTSKWKISPMSFGMTNEANVESPNEIAIVSIGNRNFKYEKGYYTITCRYSLDDYFQESMEKKAAFVIE